MRGRGAGGGLRAGCPLGQAVMTEGSGKGRRGRKGPRPAEAGLYGLYEGHWHVGHARGAGRERPGRGGRQALAPALSGPHCPW